MNLEFSEISISHDGNNDTANIKLSFSDKVSGHKQVITMDFSVDIMKSDTINKIYEVAARKALILLDEVHKLKEEVGTKIVQP